MLFAIVETASSMLNARESIILYNGGTYWPDEKDQRYIDLMEWFDDGSNTLLFFVTEWTRGSGRSANDDGTSGSHLACRN